MLNVRNRSMQNTNLFVLLLILSGWISSIHGQQALNWQIFSCQLFYDRNNVNINTDNTIICFSSPPMPCNCNHRVVYGDPLADGSAATTLHLTDNSYLHYTIRLDRPNLEYWSIEMGTNGLQFVYGPAVNLPPNATSEINIYDINDFSWHSLTWYHTYNSLVPNLNALCINLADNIDQYAVSTIEFKLLWTGDGNGVVEPAYIILNGEDSKTNNPTVSTKYPSQTPSNPTKYPSQTPSSNPTKYPTQSPSSNQTKYPSQTPSSNPTEYPSQPTVSPSNVPTNNPTLTPTNDPTLSPTYGPTTSTYTPSISPTGTTQSPIKSPSISPIISTNSPTTAQPTNTQLEVQQSNKSILILMNSVYTFMFLLLLIGFGF